MCVWCTWLEDQYPDALNPNLMDKKVDTFHEDIPSLFAVMEKKNCIFWDIRVIPLTFNHKPTNGCCPLFILLDEDERCEKC